MGLLSGQDLSAQHANNGLILKSFFEFYPGQQHVSLDHAQTCVVPVDWLD